MVYLFSFFNANEGASGATNILEKEVVELEFDFCVISRDALV